jgi:hypothetical protein
MLNSKALGLVDKMVRVEFEEREEQLGREIVVEKNQAAMHGVGSSSAVVERVYELCAHDIAIRTRIVWQNLVRFLSLTGLVASDALAQELKTVVQSYHPLIYTHPFQRLQKVSTNFASRRDLSQAWERARTKVEADIDHFVMLLQRAQEQQSGSQPVFHISSVGAIQTGLGATANIVMNIGPQEREELARALDTVKESLSKVETVPADQIADVVELVDEAKTEIGKPKPNTLRLRSALSTIATAIQTIGSLQPAYQALKAALLPLGIMLP